MAGDAIDQQPRTALPNPARSSRSGLRAGFFVRQRIIQPHSAPHHEAAIGNVVGIAGGPLFLCAIQQKRANLKRIFAGQGSGRIAGPAVRHLACPTQRHHMRLARRG